jgi:hypothetical protein
MDMPGWFGPTLRLSNVTITRKELETRLGRAVDRFGVTRDGQQHYAQISIDGDLWPAVLTLTDEAGAGLQDLLQTRAIAAAALDLGLPFWDDVMAVKAEIPSIVATSLGRAGINITVSVYLTSHTSSAVDPNINL